MLRQRERSTLFLAVLWGLSLLSCGDELQNLPPRITMVKPSGITQVAPGDTLHVIADILDETLITKVGVQLVGEDLVPAGPMQEYAVGALSYRLDAHYIIPADLRYQESFSILVRAYDDEEFKNKYTELLLLFPPARRMGVILVTQEAPLLKKVWLLDSTWQLGPLLQVNADSGASLLWGDKQLLILAGSIQGDLQVYDLRDTSLAWEVPAVPDPPFAYFTGLAADATTLWVGFEEGFISGYSATGVKNVQTPHVAAWVPQYITRSGSDIAAWWKERVGASGRIYWHHSSSGVMRDFAPLSGEVRAVDASDATGMTAFGNAGGDGTVWKEVAGAMAIDKTFSGKLLWQGLVMPGADYLVALSDGVSVVDGLSGSQASLMPGVQAACLAFDEQAGVVLGAKGNTLYYRSLAGGNVLSIQVPGQITGIHPWYMR